jgi:chemotaxis protein MotA
MNKTIYDMLSLLLLAAIPIVTGITYDWATLLTSVAIALSVSLFSIIQIPLRNWSTFLVRPLFVPSMDNGQTIDSLIELANISRRDGILYMESIHIDDALLASARNHCVDGADTEFLEFVLKREKQTVIGQVLAIRDTVTNITLSVTLVLLFQVWVLAAGNNMTGILPWFTSLFLLFILHLLIKTSLEKVNKELDYRYQLVIDGMLGIMRGVPPLMLRRSLAAGQHFDWLANKQNNLDIWEVTPEQIQEKLDSYLKNDHRQISWVNTPLQPARKTDGRENDGWCFDDMHLLDDKGFQCVIREVAADDWITAIKGAKPDIVRQFINNLSPRTAETMLDDLKWERLKSEEAVKKAQLVILKTARRLESEGAIVIMGYYPIVEMITDQPEKRCLQVRFRTKSDSPDNPSYRQITLYGDCTVQVIDVRGSLYPNMTSIVSQSKKMSEIEGELFFNGVGEESLQWTDDNGIEGSLTAEKMPVDLKKATWLLNEVYDSDINKLRDVIGTPGPEGLKYRFHIIFACQMSSGEIYEKNVMNFKYEDRELLDEELVEQFEKQDKQFDAINELIRSGLDELLILAEMTGDE